MKRRVVGVLVLGLVVAAVLANGIGLAQDRKEEKKAVPQIGHMVYFQLKEPNAENRKKLVDACKKYLHDHPGTVYFSAGIISDDFKRDVNDREWDVALHLVFKDKAAHDVYQDAPRHLKFIEENKAGWKKVRVFDSNVE